MYMISSITIEGLHNVKRKTYTFDDNVTYFYGPNGAGKSTVLNAIQLALLGYIPGTGKNASSIMQHANCPEIRVSVDLKSQDGDEVIVTRSFKKKGSGATSTVTVNPTDIDIDTIIGDSKLPIFDWSEFTSLTSNKLKDWFIQFIPGMNQDVNWSQELSSVTDGLIYCKNIVSEYSERFTSLNGDSSLDNVIEANKILKSDLSYVKASLTEKENTLNGLMDYDTSDLEEVSSLEAQLCTISEQLDHAKEKYKDFTSKARQLSKIRSEQIATINSYEVVKEQVQNLRSDTDIRQELEQSEQLIEDLTEKREQVQSNICELDRKLDSKDAILSSVITELQSLDKVINSTGTCPYTDEHCESIVLLRDEYLSKSEDLKSSKQNIMDDITCLQEERSKLTSHLLKVQDDIDDTSNNIRTLNFELKQTEQLSDKLKSISLPSDDEMVTEDEINVYNTRADEYQSEILSLTDSKNSIQRSIESSKLVDTLTVDKYKLQEKVDILNSWVKLTSANGLQTTLSSEGFNKLENNLTSDIKKLFGENTTCKFNVTNKANSFSFGINRDGTYIPYDLLSTGEKTLYTFILMSYIARNSNSEVKLVMMDDFFDHLDSNNLNMLMSIISSTDDIQVVMAGVASVKYDNLSVVVL